MDAETAKRQLALAEDHVAHSRRFLARQRGIVTLLELDGRDTENAKALLAQFEELQRLYIAERDRILRELDN